MCDVVRGEAGEGGVEPRGAGVTALRHEGRWSRVSLWRLRAIVGESLTITIVAILPLPLYYALDGNEAAVVRITSGVLAVKFALAIWLALGIGD